MKTFINLKTQLSVSESSVIEKSKILTSPNPLTNVKNVGFHDGEKAAELARLLGYLSFFMAMLSVISLCLGIGYYIFQRDVKAICQPFTPAWFPLFASILFIVLIVVTPVLIMCSMLFSQGEDKLAACSAVLYFGICPSLYFIFSGGDLLPAIMEPHNQSSHKGKCY
jgi:cytochrome bd-type quinol oxidase subunit 2